MPHFYNRLYLKVIAIAFISIFLFNTALRAQKVPLNEDFSSYSANNPLLVRKITLGTAALPLTFQYISPLTITGTSPMFLGDLGPTGLFRTGLAYYFNATTGGLIPGAGSSGPAEYRITFAPLADLTAPAGNFGLQSMYLSVGTGNISNVEIQGYRAGVMVANAVMTAGDGSSSASATDLVYAGSDAYSGITISFGSNWQFLDEIRFHLPNGQYPLMVDDLYFNSPSNIAPTAQTTTTVTSVSGSTAKINWTDMSATADGVAVFMKAINTGTASPVDQSSPVANAVFGSGSEIGSSGWYCVYKGKAVSVDVTGLAQGTTYRVMAVAYNGAPGWDTYGTGATTNITNLTTIAAPTTQASDVIVTPNYTDRRRVLISWIRGNGNRCAVFVRNETVTTGPAIPPVVNNTTYTAFTDSASMATLSPGRVGTSGWYCVYNGASSGQGLPGAVSMNRITVASGQLFNVMVMEYNGAAGSETYNINTATLNPVQYLGGDAPATVTLPAENILSTSADVKATVDPRMGNITGIVFTYADNPTLISPLGTISTVTPIATSILGSASATTVRTNITGLIPSTQYYYRVAATNNAGTNNGAILSFTTAPMLTSVSADIADGHYKAGTVIPVTLTFTSNVVVTGTPVLSLGSPRIAYYASGSGTSVLTFNYTVGAGEDIARLDVSSISMAGAAIKDIYGTDAERALASAASLGSQKNIVIDTQVPVLSLVNITSDNANTSLAKTGDVITLNFTSNEIILPPAVSVAGHVVAAVNIGGNNWSAIYTMVNGDAEGALAFSISFSDRASNAGVDVTATTNASQVVVDGTVPALNPVTIFSDNTNATRAKVGNTITLQFTSSETIGVPVVTIAGHGIAAINTGGNNYTANYTMTNSDVEGVITFDIACSDLAGNAATFTAPSGITFDRTAPALNPVTIVSDNTNTTWAKAGNTITLQFTSSETIGVPVVTIAGHGVTAINTGGNNYTANYTMTSGDAEGIVAFDIVCSDLAGNAATAVTSPSGITFDRTAPVLNPVTIVSDNATATKAKVGNIITLQFTSSETIAVPVVTIAGHIVNATNTAANNWSATYAMTNSDAEGIVAFDIVCSDLVGNAATAVTSPSGITFDRTAPVLNPVTIVSDNAITTKAKVGNMITLQFTSSETITAPVVTIVGHGVTAINTGGNNYTANYTMTNSDAEGIVAFDIVCSDLVGNPAATVTSPSGITFDRTAPVLNAVTIVSDNATATKAKVGNIITLQFTSSETIAVPVVTIAGHGVTAINTGGNNFTANYTMTSGDAEGIVAFDIVYSDLAGNAATAVTSPSGITFDRTAPVLNAVTIVSDNATATQAKVGNTITLQFASSETIAAPIVTIAGHGVTAINTGGNNYTANYTMTNGDAEGVVAFNIAFSDITGNIGVAVTATNNNIVFDRTAPSVLSINRQSPLTPIAGVGSVVYRVTFSEIVKGVSTSAFVLGRTGTANGTIAVVSTNEGTVIDVTVNNVITGGTLRLDLTGTGILDQAGNAIAIYSAGEQYTVNTSPAFTVSGPQAITLCSNASVAIQDLLQTRDDDNGQTLTWTVINNAAHGAISGLPFTANTNGANVIPTSITYTPAANYVGTDAFTVQVSDGYASATLTFQVTVNAIVPSVVLAVIPGNKVSVGTLAIFTATATNGGATPVYTFKVNGQDVQTGSLNTFSSGTLSNGDVVTCDLTGNVTCASAPVVTSNSITMEIVQPVSLYIYPNPASSIVHVSSVKPMIKIIISNGQGKVVLFRHLAEVLMEDINVSGLSAGIYYITIVDSNARKQKGKFIVVK